MEGNFQEGQGPEGAVMPHMNDGHINCNFKVDWLFATSATQPN
jgi:hypothetical protein